MSNQSVKQFWMKIENDTELKRQVEELFQNEHGQSVAKANSIVDLGRKHGFYFTKDELRAHLTTMPQHHEELSEAELAGVSGGAFDAFIKFDTSSTNFKYSQGTILF